MRRAIGLHLILLVLFFFGCSEINDAENIITQLTGNVKYVNEKLAMVDNVRIVRIILDESDLLKAKTPLEWDSYTKSLIKAIDEEIKFNDLQDRISIDSYPVCIIKILQKNCELKPILLSNEKQGNMEIKLSFSGLKDITPTSTKDNLILQSRARILNSKNEELWVWEFENSQIIDASQIYVGLDVTTPKNLVKGVPPAEAIVKMANSAAIGPLALTEPIALNLLQDFSKSLKNKKSGKKDGSLAGMIRAAQSGSWSKPFQFLIFWHCLILFFMASAFFGILMLIFAFLIGEDNVQKIFGFPIIVTGLFFIYHGLKALL